MVRIKVQLIITIFGLIAAGLAVDNYLVSGIMVNSAQAQRGPASPRGAVRRTSRRTTRRTTRRVMRRSSTYVNTLPRGCTTVYIDGVSLHQCGTTYYQPYNNQYVVVYVD